ncbi:MAG: PAS domain S-box protein [Rubricoccaceae bacterium]
MARSSESRSSDLHGRPAPPAARALRQQAALADLGLRALESGGAAHLARHAVRLVGEALGTPAVGLFEHAGDLLRLHASTGWYGLPEQLSPEAPGVAAVLGAGEPVPCEALPEAAPETDLTAGLAVRLGEAGATAGLLGAFAPASHVFDAQDAGFLAAVAAILSGALEQERAARALDEAEARARAVLETTVDGIITIDPRGAIESFNPAAERIFGYRAEEVLGRNVRVLMPEPYHAEHDGYMQAYRETGRARIIGIGREVTGRRKDGSTFPMDLAVSEVEVGGRRLFTGLVRDISSRRALEQEVLRTAEAERRRIGQDLHDGLGQMLTGTALIARGLARALAAQDHPAAQDAAELVRLIKEADQYARGLARGLVPVELEAGGLAAALERLAASAKRLLGVQCAFELAGEAARTAVASLPDPAPAHLFRIAQEALSNAVRHGRAKRVTITLAQSDRQLRLRIQDDGIGFAAAEAERSDSVPTRPAEATAAPGPASGDGAATAPPGLRHPHGALPDAHRGMGVSIMHYRARVLGGVLEIRPGPSGGTLVTCTLPLDARAAATS